MRILFLGYIDNPEKIVNTKGTSVAGNKMQLNVIKGINKHDVKIDVISIKPTAPFPLEKYVFVKKKQIIIDNNINVLQIPFVNIPFVKQLYQIRNVYKWASRYIEENPDTVILTYNMYPQVGNPAVTLKKKYGVKVVSLLADLPIDSASKRNIIDNYFRKIFDNRTKKNIKQADKLIVLNENAQKRFAPNVPFIVVEGGVNPEEFAFVEKSNIFDDGKKHIIYGGALSEYSGIKDLIEAMNYVVDSDIVLDIYGNGDLKEYVEGVDNSRIVYHGSVANKEMLSLQKSAWLLVNPRPVDNPISQVTFPSKVFEYMMSGTPALITRIDGMKNEYEKYLYLVESNTPRELGQMINRIAMNSVKDLQTRAQAAREFVLNEKNWSIQTLHMVDFIKE